MIAKIMPKFKITVSEFRSGGVMLTQADVNILRMMTLGFGAREIASTLNLGLKEFTGLYAGMPHKTKCWDDIELGLWWQQNMHKYKNVLLDNLSVFDLGRKLH